MKIIHIKYLPLLSGILCAVCLLFCGCTKQAFEDCSKEAVLKVVAVDVEGEEIDDPTVIDGVALYVFDNSKKFLRTVYTTVGSIEQISFPDQDTLHIVSWGNLTDQNQKLPEMHPGMPIHEALVQLKTSEGKPQGKTVAQMLQGDSQAQTRTQTRAIAQSPDDLFYSYDVISLRSSDYAESYKLYMSRASAAMTITMRNLQSYANRYDENYSLVVRETYDAIDFYGRLTGNKVGYIPASFFNNSKELVAPLFNLLPSHPEGTIEIDVYNDGELITTVQNALDGKPLQAKRGQVLNILVNFHLTVTVEVGMTPWGVTKIWKDF